MPYLPITATLYRCEEIGEQRQTNGSQRHREGSAHNPQPIPQEVRRLSCTEFIPYGKEGYRMSIGRRVVLLLAMVLVAATLATMSAASAFADDGLSDSQLRHKINVIQNRPGPLTNQERDHIQNLRDRIHDNDDNDDDNDDDDDD